MRVGTSLWISWVKRSQRIGITYPYLSTAWQAPKETIYHQIGHEQAKTRLDSHPEWQPTHRCLAKIANRRSRADIPIQTKMSVPRGYPPVLQGWMVHQRSQHALLGEREHRLSRERWAGTENRQCGMTYRQKLQMPTLRWPEVWCYPLQAAPNLRPTWLERYFMFSLKLLHVKDLEDQRSRRKTYFVSPNGWSGCSRPGSGSRRMKTETRTTKRSIFVGLWKHNWRTSVWQTSARIRR